METRKRWMTSVLGALIGMTCSIPAFAQTYEPAVDYTSLLNMKFHGNGSVRFGDANLAFAPADTVNASVKVVDAAGNVVGKYDYFPDYVYTVTSFGRIRVKGLGEVQMQKSGKYFIEYTVSGKASTRFPFSVTVKGSGDAFHPNKKFSFEGSWRSLGYIWMRQYKNTALPDVVFWTGRADLRPGTTNDKSIAKLFRNGKMIAHSKRSAGYITDEHYKESSHAFLAPHEARKEAVAAPFTKEKFLVDGNYNIRIERQSDNALLRNFAFTVANGQVKQLPNSVLGYQPNSDFLVPRVPIVGNSSYAFRPAIWIEDAARK